MRILYLTRDFTTHDHRFLSSLAKSEHQVFYLRLENKNQGLESRTLPEQVTKVEWAGGKSPAKIWNALRLIFSLRKVIKEIQPDIIHAGPIQSAGLLAALSGFRPLIVMSWAYDLLFDANKNLFYRWATKKTLRKTDLLLADCEMIADLAIEKGYQNKHVAVFPWGIDLERFSPGTDMDLRKQQGWGKEEFVILHNRAWEKLYGVDQFAQAFVTAARKHPELRLFLMSHGSLSSRLKQIFMEGGVIEKVKVLGQVRQDALPNYYRASDLYVSASHSDGSSVSMMEALASGLPVLLSYIPGNKEWITEGQEGWLFKDGDIDSLSVGIISAVENRKELKMIGKNARKLAEEKADWSKNFEKLLKAYELAKGLYV